MTERKMETLIIHFVQAQLHGHKPSKGAMIDKELKDEEAEIIAKKTQEGKGMAGEKR